MVHFPSCDIKNFIFAYFADWLPAMMFIGGLLALLLGLCLQFSSQKYNTKIEKPFLHHACPSNETAEHNLPYTYRREHFVGRNRNLEDISGMLINNTDVAMVNIFGAPAVGKSLLAIKVGHKLAQCGISVKYINVYEARYLFKSTSSEGVGGNTSTIKSANTTDVLSSLNAGVAAYIPWRDSHTEEKYVLTSPQRLIKWAKALSNDTLLVLDNCDDLLQEKKYEKNFKEFLTKLLQASKHHLRIIVTSRMQVLSVDAHPYPLKELDPGAAVKLLQLESKNINDEEGKEIAMLVANNPLALVIFAKLVTAKAGQKTTKALIGELNNRTIKTLSDKRFPESQRIQNVLELSYNYLDDTVQLCSHYLSHFPGSFHRNASLNILRMCNFNDSQHCLDTLVIVSLLSETSRNTNQERYQFHRLIREFFLYVHDQSLRNSRVQFIFKYSYHIYYSLDIASLAQKYREGSELISELECDNHNFLHVLLSMADQDFHFQAQSTVNVAYGFSNSTSFFLEVLGDRKDQFAKLLRALIFYFSWFGQQQLLQEIGLNETTYLYFNLISNMKQWLISHNDLVIDDSTSCLSLCYDLFEGHHSRADKLSIALSNALDTYYYHPLACYMDCYPIAGNLRVIVLGVICAFTSIVTLCSNRKSSKLYILSFFSFMHSVIIIFGLILMLKFSVGPPSQSLVLQVSSLVPYFSILLSFLTLLKITHNVIRRYKCSVEQQMLTCGILIYLTIFSLLLPDYKFNVYFNYGLVLTFLILHLIIVLYTLKKFNDMSMVRSSIAITGAICIIFGLTFLFLYP